MWFFKYGFYLFLTKVKTESAACTGIPTINIKYTLYVINCKYILKSKVQINIVQTTNANTLLFQLTKSTMATALMLSMKPNTVCLQVSSNKLYAKWIREAVSCC